MAATHAVLNVPSVSCNHCKMAIEGAVNALDGIAAVQADIRVHGQSFLLHASVLTGLERIRADVAGADFHRAGANHLRSTGIGRLRRNVGGMRHRQQSQGQ